MVPCVDSRRQTCVRLPGTATGAERKNRGTTVEQPFPKWSDGSADWRTGGRPEVAAGIDVFGGERRQFPESTGRARRTNLQVSTLDCKRRSGTNFYVPGVLQVRSTSRRCSHRPLRSITGHVAFVCAVIRRLTH